MYSKRRELTINSSNIQFKKIIAQKELEIEYLSKSSKRNG